MFVDIDYNKRKKGYKIHLAKPNKEIISVLSESYNPTYNVKLGNVNELTFSIPYYIDKESEREYNKNIDLIKEKMYVRIKYNGQKEWMLIDSLEDIGEGDSKTLVVNAFSNVYENRGKRIPELQLEAVNPEEYFDTILEDTAWVLGQVDGTFTNMYRTFDINDSTTLEAILEGGSTFGAVLDFDSENRKINLVDMNKNAEYRGLKINYNNFLNSINRKRDTDSMATRLYVYGSEDLSISRVNPTGMNYLEDFSYFLEPFKRDENKNVLEHSHYMSDELAHAILDMEELTKEYAPQIQSKQLQMDEMTIELINLETQLTNLNFDKSTIQGLLEIAKATGDTDLITQRQQELSQAETLVKNKEVEVNDLGRDINRIDQEIINMQNSISVTSFTKELRDELNPFIIESEFRDDRYVDDAELYDDAVKKFEEAKTPNIVIDASIENIIDSLEEDYFSDKIVLGDLARVVDKDMNIDYKSVIIELSFNLDNEECQLVIANNTDDKDGFDDVLSVLYNTQSTTSRLEASKNKWDSVTELRTEVDIMREEGIDAVRRRITAGVNESVEISERGVVLTNPDFPDEMVIMQAGVIALSTDGGENWNTSITPQGVIADTVIGRLVASNNLIITNESGSFKIDSDGMTVDMDSIKIMSGSGETPQNMIDSWNQVLLTMEDFANDNVLNEYEKNQIDKQWKSIMVTHASMIQVAQDAYGPESEENPYPIEYDRYLEAYENLNRYLNVTKQSDGHPILDPATRNQTTPIDSAMYENVINEYQKNKDIFQTVIPLDFAQSSIEVLEAGIALTYVKNGEVATQLNLSEEGVKIDGRLLEINSKTAFNDDMVMNAGVIRSKDNSIVIDLNAGTINLTKPLTINAVPVVTQDDLDDLSLESGKSAYEIAVDFGFEGTESEWLASLQGPRGEQGIGIDGESAYMHIAWADNADGTIGFTQINTANKMFMGVYTDNNPQSSALPTKYKWTKIKGEDASTVKLSGETQVIKVDKDGNITPSSTFVVQGVGINTSITQWTYAVNGGDFSSSQPIGVSRDGNIVTISPQTSTFQILTVRAGDGKVFDEFSIARTNDGVSGKDAYTVLLSNESHTFAENSAGILAGSVATRIIAYKGTTPIPVTINSVTGLPTGLTSSISQNNTVNATVTFTANNSLTESSGTVQIRLELEGKSMSKEFSYAVALKGDKGDKGEQGTSITSVDVEYAQSTSATTAPTTGWSTTAPTWKDGQYIWSRTKTTYSTGDPTYSNPAVITGQKGGTGATGSAGRGISSIVEQYYLSTSKTTQEGGTWVEEPPTWVSGRYMWTRSKINYTNPTGTEYTTPVVDSAWEALEGVTLKDKDYQVGTEVSTDKADDNSVVHVEVDGKSVGGGSGKNLINNKAFKDYPQHPNYVGSNHIVLKLKPNTKYTMSTNFPRHPDGNNAIYFNGVSGTDVPSDGVPKTTTTDGEGNLFILTFKNRPDGELLYNGTYWVQLEEGVVATDYEPPTPTPDYPIQITSLGEHYSLTKGVTPRLSTYVLETNGLVYSAVGHSTLEFIPVNPNTKYVIYGTDGLLYQARLVFYDVNKNYIEGKLFSNQSAQNATYTSPSNASFVTMSAGNGVSAGSPIENWVLREESIRSNFDVVSSVSNENLLNQSIEGKEYTGAREFLNSLDWDMAPAFDKYGTNKKYTLSFDLKSAVAGEIRVYALNGSATKYGISTNVIQATQAYERYSLDINVSKSDTNETRALLAFYGTYDTGRIPTVKNVKLSLKNTDKFWVPSPEHIQPETPSPTIYKTNISLPEPLRSVGDVKDRLFRDTDGLWKVERFVGEMALNPDYILKYPSLAVAGLTKFYTTELGSSSSLGDSYKNNSPLLSNRFKMLPVNMGYSGSEVGISTYSGNTALYGALPTSALITDDQAGLRKWFSDNQVTVLYQKQDSTIEILSDDLQQKLNNIQSYGSNNSNVFNTKTPYEVNVTFQGYKMKLKPNRAYTMTTNIPDSGGVNFNTFISTGEVLPSHQLNGVSENYPRTIYTDSNGDISVAVRYGAINDGFQSGTYWIKIQEAPVTNYVYTTSNLTPTLYATFKSRGWYDKYLTETELKAVNDKADSKADQEQVDKVAEDLSNFETIVATKEELSEIITSLNEYATMLDSNETSLQQASTDISNLLNRVPILENNLGTFTENWSFLDTYMTAGEEGLIIGSQGSGTAIRIAKDRIDFMDGAGEPVAFITNQIMQINRGIFVQSATIGQHKIETITGGHTIWQWVPPS